MPRKGAPPKSGPRPQKEGQAAQYRIGGVDLPYDPDLDIEGKKPTPLFPVRPLFQPIFFACTHVDMFATCA